MYEPESLLPPRDLLVERLEKNTVERRKIETLLKLSDADELRRRDQIARRIHSPAASRKAGV